MKELKVITSNIHKFEELEERLNGLEIELVHIKTAYPEVQAETIREVAIQSATTLMTFIEPPFIIEDSGLSIDHLNGFPGPYSSFVFKTIGWEGILRLMNDVHKRIARFTSIIVLVDKQKNIHVFEGIQGGEISEEGRGIHGFGFDPIFVPGGADKTFGEMDLSVKNQYSHRGKSGVKLRQFLQTL